jgi:hypothetical protein
MASVLSPRNLLFSIYLVIVWFLNLKRKFKVRMKMNFRLSLVMDFRKLLLTSYDKKNKWGFCFVQPRDELDSRHFNFRYNCPIQIWYCLYDGQVHDWWITKGPTYPRVKYSFQLTEKFTFSLKRNCLIREWRDVTGKLMNN